MGTITNTAFELAHIILTIPIAKTILFETIQDQDFYYQDKNHYQWHRLSTKAEENVLLPQAKDIEF